LPHSDLDWVRRAIHGDALGRHEFVVRLERVPATLARRNARLGRPLDRGDLDDLFQEIASLVWAKLGEYSGLGSFDGWVFRFCDLGFRNSARRRKKRPAPLSSTQRTAGSRSAFLSTASHSSIIGPLKALAFGRFNKTDSTPSVLSTCRNSYSPILG